jgi:hypothetical protein
MIPSMRALRALVGAALVVWAAACGGNDDAVIPEGAEELSFSTESPQGDRWVFLDTDLEVATRSIIRDEPAWRALWQALFANRSVMPPLPAIDFTREMVIAVAIGSRPTGGYRVEITAVHAMGGDLYISFRETQPDPATCVTTQALTSPAALARVSRSVGRVHFVGSVSVHRCE